MIIIDALIQDIVVRSAHGLYRVLQGNPLSQLLDQEAREWAATLPPHLSGIDPAALLAQLFRKWSGPADEHMPAQAKLRDELLLLSKIPDKQVWYAALYERWRLVRERLGEQAQPFFLSPEDQVSAHLSVLAERLMRTSAKHPPLFQQHVVQYLRDIESKREMEISKTQSMIEDLIRHIRKYHPAIIDNSQKQDQLSPSIRETRTIVTPLQGQNRVYPSREDQLCDAFDIECHLIAHIGRSMLVLKTVHGNYWAHGCPCLPMGAILKIGDQKVALLNNNGHIANPPRLEPGGVINITFVREFWPPLPEWSASDCHYGDISFELVWWDTEKQEEFIDILYFRFDPGGELSPIDSIRCVPLFNNKHLEALHSQGLLDDRELASLMMIDPIKRYLSWIMPWKAGKGIGYLDSAQISTLDRAMETENTDHAPHIYPEPMS